MDVIASIHWIIAVMVGAIAGFTGGLFGVSGGTIVVAVLAADGLDQRLAQGTSLVVQLPTVLTGLWRYGRQGTIDGLTGTVLALSSIPAAYVGSRLATHINSTLLRHGFAIFLLLMASFTVWNALERYRDDRAAARPSRSAACLLGLMGGFASGLFGIGGAAIVTPALVRVFKVKQATAQGLSLAVVLPAVIVGLGTYTRAGYVDWNIGIPLALGGVMCVAFGVKLAHALPERFLRFAFAALLGSVSLFLLLKP